MGDPRHHLHHCNGQHCQRRNRYRDAPLPATASLVARGNSQRLQGVSLYDITNIAIGHENNLSIRFFILNPHEMSLAFGSEKTFLELTVTDFSNPNEEFAAATASAEEAGVTLLPRGVPAGTTQLKIRGNIVIPGGRAGGAEQPAQKNLIIFVEVSQRSEMSVMRWPESVTKLPTWTQGRCTPGATFSCDCGHISICVPRRVLALSRP